MHILLRAAAHPEKLSAHAVALFEDRRNTLITNDRAIMQYPGSIEAA
jgi:hypothetical protein